VIEIRERTAALFVVTLSSSQVFGLCVPQALVVQRELFYLPPLHSFTPRMLRVLPWYKVDEALINQALSYFTKDTGIS